MTSQRLNDDCIYYVIKFLQYNHSNPFNYLLVNRFWCKVTVPLLYENPFSNLKDKSKILIVKTFLLCLNEEERTYLTNQDSICKVRKFFQNNPLRPIFEYPKYIKHLPKILIYNAVDQWYRQQKINTCIPLKIAFYHMFLRQSNYIRNLEIFSDIFDGNIFDLHFINTFIFNISNLTNLQLYYHNNNREIFSEFLQVFAKNCKNLSQLSFEQFGPYDHLNEISLIIKEQSRLKEFDYHIFTIDKPTSDIIFTSLEYQKDSLVSLKLYNITFQESILQSIIKLHHLKSLEIDIPYDMTLELCGIFEFALFKLQILSIRNKFCKEIIISQIIKFLGITLQMLKVKYVNMEIMEKIVQYCLELKTLDFEFSNKNLTILPCLKILKIKNLNLHLFTTLDNEELFFLELAKNLSETTTNISFITLKVIDKHNLLIFLNNCHKYIISLNLKCKCNLGHFKVILNYIKKNNDNNLKYLRIYDLDKIQNSKELILLHQIKKKGVNLVEFVDNYKENDYSYSD
ncbi:hypothetical protein C1645_828178 [Glomus cerebriforme]|uniref:F-box domain-containing protein n=1 Tax=Glomus cerebriforme TaxID=658196 RepID=A0A397SM98_9GLOM|nr:hypothetical protein C1645_828178 [Glomus cerebriforme]